MKKSINISTIVLLLTTATISNAMDVDMTADLSASAAASANITSSSTTTTQQVQLAPQGRAVLEIGNPQNPFRFEMSQEDALSLVLGFTFGSRSKQAIQLALHYFESIQSNTALKNQVKAHIEQQCGKGIIDQVFVISAEKEETPLATFDALLALDADINAQPVGFTNFDSTALDLAAENGNAALVRYLIQKGASLTVKNRVGNTPFGTALFYCKNLETIQAFLEGGASINEICGMGNRRDAETVLTEAARASGSTPEIIHYLISKGASVNQPNKEGETPLMKAVNSDKVDIAECLIRAGADVHARCNNGKTVLMHAVTPWFLNGEPTHHEAVVALLLAHGAQTDIAVPGQLPRYQAAPVTSFPILECISCGLVNAARLLITAGADIHVIDSLNRTSLMWAASNGKSDLVKLLLENGAQSLVNHKDSKGNTALHYALSSYSAQEIIALLLKAGADLYARNNEDKAIFDRVNLNTNPRFLIE